MKKLFHRVLLICVVSVILLLSGCETQKAELPKPTEKFFVNDFAEVLSDEDADKIYSAGVLLANSSAEHLGTDTGAQVVAVTVTSTGGLAPSEYALNLAREWGVGSSENNNGVVILLATEDREVYVSVGYGLEGALPDSKVGRIIDNYGYDYFAENEFSAGMLNLYSAVVREVYSEYGLSVPEGVSVPKNYSEDVDPLGVGISWLGILLFLVVFALYFRRTGLFFILSPGFRGSHYHFGGPGGFGGGHSSGGFGGFSGGGGGFGGGGAGRGF